MIPVFTTTKLPVIRYLFQILFVLQIAFLQAQSVKKDTVRLPEVEFSVEGGFYQMPLEVSLLSPGARIYYTTDGSQPSRYSRVYKKPIRISRTQVVRAFAMAGRQKGEYYGATYFIREPATTFPVVSIAASASLFFDPEFGLFVEGFHADNTLKRDGANFWSNKEAVVHTEIFESDGSTVFNSNTGLRVFGGMSRLFPQKSMSLFTRDRYGDKKIHYPIFGPDAPKKFKSLVLRNGGSDWGKTHFRDELMTSLTEGWNLDHQAYRPAHVYINGKYWGIYNIREKLNRYYLADHFSVDKDSVDLLEHYFLRKAGSTRQYQKLIEYIRLHDLSDNTHYAQVGTMMDIENFIDHQVAEIFFDNQDAGGNIKYWRAQRPGSKWRWLLFDTDWGMGLHEERAYANNSLAFHTEANGPKWPNPPWSTFLLRNLLKNDGFRQEFVNRFSDYLNTSLLPERVLTKIDSFQRLLEPEMPRHIDRWNLSTKEWHHQIGVLKNFARLRPGYIRQYLVEAFDTGSLAQVSLRPSPGGKIVLNDHITVDTFGFTGTYFENIPVSIRAMPEPGYRFAGWEGLYIDDHIKAFYFKPSAVATQIRAIFEPYTDPLAGKVIINEVSCNNKKSGDWIEIVNNSDHYLNLKGWILTDGQHEYALPELTLADKDFLVVCQDSMAFSNSYPDVFNIAGNLSFGLHKRKDQLGLYKPDYAAIDYMHYDVPPSDSVFTLSLMMPHLDNADMENWELTFGKGTPGSANTYYLSAVVQNRQQLWLRIGGAIALLLIAGFLLWMKQQR